MSIDDDLDRLLQGAFDQARPTGHEDLRGLREGPVARAHGLRRRRRIGTAAVSTGPLVSPEAEAYLDAALPRLLGVALSLTGHRQDAEDLVQDSVAKVLVSWSKVERATTPDAYVRRIMVNTFLSRRRLRGSSELISHDTVTSDRHATAQSSETGFVERDHLWQALSALPPRERAVMVLRHYEDLPDADIADLLGCSTGRSG